MRLSPTHSRRGPPLTRPSQGTRFAARSLSSAWVGLIGTTRDPFPLFVIGAWILRCRRVRKWNRLCAVSSKLLLVVLHPVLEHAVGLVAVPVYGFLLQFPSDVVRVARSRDKLRDRRPFVTAELYKF